MTDLLDIPRLARDVLRRYAIQRVRERAAVIWFEDGMHRMASPRTDKGPDRWLVCGEHWAQWWTTDQLIRAIATADAVEVV